MSEQINFAATTTLRLIETGVTFLTGMEFSDRRTASRTRRSTDLVLFDGPETESSRVYFSTASPHHGTDVLPTAYAELARRHIEAFLDEAQPVSGWRVTGASVRVQDYGVATAVATWEPMDDLAQRLPDESDLVSLLSAETQQLLQPLIDRTMHGLHELDPSAVPDGVVELLGSIGPNLPDYGVGLWSWAHLRYSVPRSASHASEALRLATELCPNDVTLLTHRDHTYAAGVAVSLTCSLEQRFDDGATLSEVLPKQDSWWALLWVLDRALLVMQQRVDGTMADGSISTLVARARQMEQVTSRIRLLQSRIDSVLVNSGARDMAAWQTLGAAWQLDYRTEVVHRKLDYLHVSYQGVLGETNRRRANQVSLMVYLFTAVSVVASVLAVVQYAQGSEHSGAVYRIFIVVLSVLATAGAVVSTFRAQRLRARAARY